MTVIHPADLAPADGWFGLLLSGIFGSIVGGIVTGLAVWLTIRHEKKTRAEDRLNEFVETAYGTAGALDVAFLRNTDVEQMVALYQQFTLELSLTLAVSKRLEITLAELLADGTKELRAATEALDPTVPNSNHQLASAVRAIQTAFSIWLASPEAIRDRRITFATTQQIAEEAHSSPSNDSAIAARLVQPKKRWR